MLSRVLVRRNLRVPSWLPNNTRAVPARCYSQESRDKTALVIGSSGALGDTVSRYLGRDLGMKVIGADVVEIPSDFNSSDWELDGFITLPRMVERPSIAEVTAKLALGLNEILGEEEELDAIVCASGGWAGDPKPITGKTLTAEEIRSGAHEYGEAVETMLYMNLIPVVAAGYCAQQFLGQNGLYVVMGATVALTSTPGMLGYGLSKAASHHLVQSMGATTGKSLETRVKRKEGRRFRQFASQLDTMSVISILPTTIDTPNNRLAMPDADTDQWTKPRDIAEEIGRWIETPQLRPHSGALVKVTSTRKGSTFDLVR